MAKSLIPGADDWKKKRGIKTESDEPSLKINGKTTSEAAKDVTAKHSAPQKKTAAQSTAERSLPNIKYNFTGAKTQQKPRSLFGDVTGADFAKSGLRRVTDYATAKTRADYDENLRRIGLTRNADKDKLRREAYKLFEQQSRYDMYDFDIQNLSNVSQKLRAFKITKENLKEYEKLKKEYEQANARFNVAMAAKQQARERLLRKQEKEADKELKASVAEYLKQSGRFTAEPQKKESPYKSVEVGNKYFDRLMKNFSNDNPLSRINEAQAQADYLERDYKRRADEITKERTALVSEYERLSAGNGTPGEIESFNKRVSDFNRKAAKLESDAVLYNGKIKDINENFKRGLDAASAQAAENLKQYASELRTTPKARKIAAENALRGDENSFEQLVNRGIMAAQRDGKMLPVQGVKNGKATKNYIDASPRSELLKSIDPSFEDYAWTKEERETYYAYYAADPQKAEAYKNLVREGFEEKTLEDINERSKKYGALGAIEALHQQVKGALLAIPVVAEYGANAVAYAANKLFGANLGYESRATDAFKRSQNRAAAAFINSENKAMRKVQETVLGFGQNMIQMAVLGGISNAAGAMGAGAETMANALPGGTSLMTEQGIKTAQKISAGMLNFFYGGSTAGQEFWEAKERGASDGQAILSGAVKGMFEAVFNNIGTIPIINNIGSGRVAKGTSGNFYKRMLSACFKEGLGEFGEEFATQIAQELTDAVVMGDISNYNAYVDALKKQGYGEEDANMKALWELYGRAPLEAGFSGFVMGALSGAMVNTSNVFEAGKYADAKKIEKYLKGELNQNYMGETGKAAASLRADAIKGLKTARNTQNPVRAAWNMGRAATGAAELADMPKLIINSDSVYRDINEEAQNKIETTKDGKKYVKADRQVIFTNNPDNWGKELEAYINDEIRRGQDVNIVTEDGDVLKITADTAWKIGDMHGWDEEAFPVKMDMGTHIDELAQVSRRTNARDAGDRSNKRFQPDKFEHRTAFFEDFDGTRYRIYLSAGVDKNGKTVYSIGKNIKRRSSPGSLGPSANRRRSSSGAPSSNSIRENGEKYNSNFNQNNKWTSERIAQLDNAVKKSGVNIIIEDIPQAEVEGNKVRQGAYYRNANTIVIDPRVSDVQIANTVLFHELAHSTEGTKYYDEFKNYIKGIKGEEFITETEKKMKSLRLSREEAESEAVADFVKDIFRGGTEEMNGFLARNYTAAREITDTMKNIIDSVKIRFGVEPSSVYERAVRSFEKALAKRETGGEATQYSDRITEEDIRYSTGEVSPEEKARLLREEEERRKEYGSKGGYEGHSMSRRAAEAYSSGEKPISKWTKSEILTGIEETAWDNDIDIEGIDFSKLTTEELKSKFLRNSSWHHTGSFYNATDFYEISAAAVAETTQEDIERIISGRTRRQLTNAERAEKAMNEKALEEAKEVYKKIKFIYDSGVTNYKSANTLFRRYANDDLDLDGLYKKAVKKTGWAEDAYKLERVSNDKGLATVKNRILEDYEAKGGTMLFETREDAVINEKDIRNIQSIPRKSINDFTSAEIEKTEAFARKYYNEMGNKSPFFRAWFGDWRENDTTPVETIIIDTAKNSIPRGKFLNADTNWDINVSAVGINDTVSHSGREKLSVMAMNNIDSIIKNAILFDSEVSKPSGKKGKNTLFMHKLYALTDIGGRKYISKLTVEEYGDGSDTSKRFYNLREIKMSSALGGLSENNTASTMRISDDKYNVSQLFALVKSLDKNFQPRESSKVVNEDGTPRRMYYTTYHSFGGYKKWGRIRPENKRNQREDMKVFTSAKNEAAEKQGIYKGGTYLDIKNPVDPSVPADINGLKKFIEAVAEDKDYHLNMFGTSDAGEILKRIDTQNLLTALQKINEEAIGDLTEAVELYNKVNNTDFDGIIKPTFRNNIIASVLYTNQIKSATENIGTYNRSNPDISYSTGEVSPEEKARLIKEDREKGINSGVFFTDGKRRNYNSSMSMWQVHSYEGKAGEEPKGDSGRIFGRGKEDKGLTSLIKEISKAYNLPINQGKVVGKNSSAEYHVRRETVRTRNVNDLPVVTHELGHHLDKKFKLVTAVEDAGQINNIVRLAGNRFLSSYSRVFGDLYLNQKKYVRALLKEYGSTTNPKEVLQNIQNLSDTVNEINQRDGAELLGVTREELPERLKQAKENEKAIREAAEIAARSILRNIEIENESGEALKELSGILRNSPVTISRSDASNIADYGSFIKKYVGVLKVKTATEGETGKRSIDSVYQTLRNEMPQYFTKDLQNGGDMLQEIGDVLSMLREERNVSIEDYSQSKEYVDELCKKLYKATAFGTGEARNATLADIENKITELETKRSKTRSEEQAAKMSGRIAKLYNELETVKKESVAEFIREYMRDSGAVDKSIKEAIIKAIPGKELEKFQKYAGKTNQYYSEGLLERLSQSGRHFGESEREETSLNDAIDNAMFNWVDDMWGVRKATDAAEKASGQTLSGQDNPYVLIMNAKNAMGTVERIVKNGMTNLEGDINLGKSLVDILKQTNDISEFEDYLKARRAVTWLTPDKDGKAKRVFADAELNNLWNAKKMVNDLEAKHPEFEEMANEIYNFQNQIIQYFGVEGGLISKETADSMLEKEPNYIPFYRDMSDKHKNASGAHKKAANVLKGASGSTRDILSPIESIIKNVETYVTLAKQQQALRALYNAIEGNEKLGWLAEAVEPDKKVSKIETSPVATQFLKAQDVLNGIMPADDESYGAEVQKFIDLLGQTIIKTEDKRSSSQNNMIPVLMSGEIKWLRVNDEILLKSLTNINRGEINPVIRIMTAFTNVFKTVSTSANIAFTFGANMGKDFVHAVFSTDSKGGLPGYAARYGKSLVQEIRKSEDFQRYLNVGGKWASSIVQDRNGFKKLLRDVNAAKSPKLVKAVRYWVLGIFDRMQDIADWVETAPRYTEFRSTYKKSGDIMQALYDSGEITVNFKRSGKKARYVEPFVPYSNAAIQGTRQIAAVTKKHPVRTLARVAAYSTLISIAAAWMRGRKDDREYENLSRYVKDNFWTVPLGGGEYISVKKPDGFGALCTIIDRAVEGIQYKNPSVFNDIASYIVGQFTPYGILEGLTEGVETAVKEKNGLKGIAAGLQDAGNNFMNGIIILGTMYQIGTNKDFKGSNIVPRKYEDMPPEEQFDENTSWIAKFLGRQLGISPMKIDHAIDSNLGIFAKVNKLTASTDEKDWFLGLASRYTKSAAFSTDIINNFYDEYDKAVKKKNVSDNPEDLMTYSFYNAERNVIGNLYNIMNEATTAEERKSVKYEMNHYIKALSQPKNEKVDNELKRLSGTEKFKSDILPYVSGDVAIKENGYDRKLSAAEYVKLQKTLDEKMYSSYDKVISSPGYAALSDEDKISALRKVREAVKDRAEFEAFENQDFSYLAKLMKADTLSKENVLYKSRNNTKTAAKYLEAMEPFTGGTLESNTALYAYKNADSYMNYMEKYSLLTAEAAQKMNEYAIKRSKAITRGDAARFGKVNETAYLFDAESIFKWTVNGNEFGIEPTPEQAYNAYILFDRDLDTALQRAYANGFYTAKGNRATYTDKYGNKQPAIWQQMPPDKLTEKIGKEKTRVKEKIRSSMQNSGKVNWYETMPDGTIVRHR